jgi:hypothetical protein
MHIPSSSLAGVENAHVHIMFSDRLPDDIERTPEETFRRYNAAAPELGGCKKDSGGKTPLALRDEVIAMRKTCAEVLNAALAKYGHSARVDPRSLKQQGIERPAEKHLGPARMQKMSLSERAGYVEARAAKPTDGGPDAAA